MRYLTTLFLLSGLSLAAAPAARAQHPPASPPATATQQASSRAAAPASNPYQATVPVADTSAAHRGHAFAEALAKVLARVSGRVPAPAVLGKASTYVLRYQYQRAPAGSPQPFQLVVGFAPSAVKHLERTLGAPAAVANPGGAHAAAPLQARGADNEVWVSGIHSAVGFADALAALRHVPGVTRVAVDKAHGNGMLLDVHTSVPLARVLANLGAGGRLVSSGPGHAGAAASLRWKQ